MDIVLCVLLMFTAKHRITTLTSFRITAALTVEEREIFPESHERLANVFLDWTRNISMRTRVELKTVGKYHLELMNHIECKFAEDACNAWHAEIRHKLVRIEANVETNNNETKTNNNGTLFAKIWT